jgi:hypothetical protein
VIFLNREIGPRQTHLVVNVVPLMIGLIEE